VGWADIVVEVLLKDYSPKDMLTSERGCDREKKLP